MANVDLVMPYDEAFETWLREQRYPHPPVKQNNRFPTKAEIFGAVQITGTLEVQDPEAYEFFVVRRGTKPGGGYEIRIGCGDWKQLGTLTTDSITMHGGYFKTELQLLEILSHKCGQLLLYPDTGSPAVIVEPNMDIDRTEKVWQESHDHSDPWKYFYEQMRYGQL